MGIDGERFLELSGAADLKISRHALRRLRERSGNEEVDEEAALELFLAARQVSWDLLPMLGYRCAYQLRRRRGEASWYFLFTHGGREMIAVLASGKSGEGIVWVTTYGRDEQTDLARAGEPGPLSSSLRRPVSWKRPWTAGPRAERRRPGGKRRRRVHWRLLPEVGAYLGAERGGRAIRREAGPSNS